MKLGCSHFFNGALCALLVGSVAAACGSDSQHRNAMDAGGAGAGGEAAGTAVIPTGGAATKPQPLGGNGGVPELGGEGGVPSVIVAGQGGAPLAATGGVPTGGEGGAPSDVLPPFDCTTIAFDDPALESAIQNQLDTGSPITPADIAELTTLDARGFSVSSLGGIECFTELTDLNLGVGGAPSAVADLGPLRYLKQLTTLDLEDNPLDDLTPLASLPNLQQLILNSSPDDLDLAPLSGCPSLTDLSLIDCTLDDLSPLGNIATLNTLQLNSTTLNQPTTLSALKNVKELHVYNASITDATPLAALKQLLILDVGGNNGLTNFNKLSTLVNLSELYAGYDGITSIAAVGSMTKLTTLDLTYNSVVDITPLTALTELSVLRLYTNQVTDLTPLVNNAGIGTGDIVDVRANSVACTGQAANLTTLRSRGTTFLTDCP